MVPAGDQPWRLNPLARGRVLAANAEQGILANAVALAIAPQFNKLFNKGRDTGLGVASRASDCQSSGSEVRRDGFASATPSR
jgi:hypothetical protein